MLLLTSSIVNKSFIEKSPAKIKIPISNPIDIGDTLAIKLNYNYNSNFNSKGVIISEQGITSTSANVLIAWSYPEEGAVETIISKFLD